MGLIKAAVGAAGGVLADQWRDYIYGEEMNADVLVMKGKKRTGRRAPIQMEKTTLSPMGLS